MICSVHLVYIDLQYTRLSGKREECYYYANRAPVKNGGWGHSSVIFFRNIARRAGLLDSKQSRHTCPAMQMLKKCSCLNSVCMGSLETTVVVKRTHMTLGLSSVFPRCVNHLAASFSLAFWAVAQNIRL